MTPATFVMYARTMQRFAQLWCIDMVLDGKRMIEMSLEIVTAQVMHLAES